MPVTQDGPSHVYNAAIAAASNDESAPFAHLFVTREGIRPNAASHAILATLGPRFGWAAAERIVILMALVGTLVAAMLLVRGALPLVAFAAWLASSWFVWMGFYDFALSLPWFVALVLLLARSPPTRGPLLLQLLLAPLYLTHFFTFAVGVVLATVVFAARAAGRSRFAWRELLPVVPAIALLLLEMATGAGGAPAWTTAPAARLRDFATADFIVTVVWLDGVVGVATMLTVVSVVAGVVYRWRAAPVPWGDTSTLAAFGAVLVLLSLAAPDAVGEGGYVPARMRLLGVVALLPAMTAAAARLSRRRQLLAAVVLMATLGWRSFLLAREARAMGEMTAEVGGLLERAGARDGAWLVTRLSAYRRWPFRIGAYRHLGERAAVDRRLVVLNNYEALYGIFSVSWRGRPDWVFFRPRDGSLVATLVPGDIRWSGPMHVLHERTARVVPDSTLEVVGMHVGRRFAVSTVRKHR